MAVSLGRWDQYALKCPGPKLIGDKSGDGTKGARTSLDLVDERQKNKSVFSQRRKGAEETNNNSRNAEALTEAQRSGWAQSAS